MSVRIPLDDAPPTRALRTDEPRFRLRRMLMTITTLVVLGSIAAVPLPMRRESAYAQWRVHQLTRELHDLRDARDALDARVERLAAEGAFDESLAVRWLEPVDPLTVRNALLTAARSLGLDVRSVELDVRAGPTVDDLDDELVLGQGGEPDDDGPRADGPRPACQFVIHGAGPASRVLLYAALLAELPHPVRVTATTLRDDDPHPTFEIQAQRLVLPSLPAGGELP